MSVDIDLILRCDYCIQRLWHLQAVEVSRMMDLPIFTDGPINELSLSASDQVELKRALESLSVIHETLSTLRTISESCHGAMSPNEESRYLDLQMDAFGSLTLYSVSRM